MTLRIGNRGAPGGAASARWASQPCRIRTRASHGRVSHPRPLSARMNPRKVHHKGASQAPGASRRSIGRLLAVRTRMEKGTGCRPLVMAADGACQFVDALSSRVVGWASFMPTGVAQSRSSDHGRHKGCPPYEIISSPLAAVPRSAASSLPPPSSVRRTQNPAHIRSPVDKARPRRSPTPRLRR